MTQILVVSDNYFWTNVVQYKYNYNPRGVAEMSLARQEQNPIVSMIHVLKKTELDPMDLVFLVNIPGTKPFIDLQNAITNNDINQKLINDLKDYLVFLTTKAGEEEREEVLSMLQAKIKKEKELESEQKPTPEALEAISQKVKDENPTLDRVNELLQKAQQRLQELMDELPKLTHDVEEATTEYNEAAENLNNSEWGKEYDSIFQELTQTRVEDVDQEELHENDQGDAEAHQGDVNEEIVQRENKKKADAQNQKKPITDAQLYSLLNTGESTMSPEAITSRKGANLLLVGLLRRPGVQAEQDERKAKKKQEAAKMGSEMMTSGSKLNKEVTQDFAKLGRKHKKLENAKNAMINNGKQTNDKKIEIQVLGETKKTLVTSAESRRLGPH